MSRFKWNSCPVSSGNLVQFQPEYAKRPYEIQKSIDGRFELLLIEGALLEEKVNEQRDGFNIPKECSPNEELEETFSIQDIMESIDDYVFSIMTPRDFDKEALIDS
ncbi:hypothetical protein ABER38_12035, partial [Cutibacterium acnes]